MRYGGIKKGPLQLIFNKFLITKEEGTRTVEMFTSRCKIYQNLNTLIPFEFQLFFIHDIGLDRPVFVFLEGSNYVKCSKI